MPRTCDITIYLRSLVVGREPVCVPSVRVSLVSAPKLWNLE